jgi:7-carboxy-7-deazaguanine synthase
MPAEPSLLVNEIFGPTWQGEGRDAGQLASFVRLGTCNLGCRWCDTPYAVFYDKRKAMRHKDGKVYDPRKENKQMTFSQIVDALRETGLPPHGIVVISGGEPLLQQIGQLVSWLLGEWSVAIETAGTLWQTIPGEHVVQWNVSPKLKSSGNALSSRYRPKILERFRDVGADFKFVVSETDDFLEVDSIVREIEIPPGHVWIMPEGRNAPEVLGKARWARDRALRRGWNFTHRNHILLFGDERGH